MSAGSNSESNAQARVQDYMLDSEEISYTLRFRPTGLINWIKSLLGIGVTYWFITNERLIATTRVAGGFNFKEIPHGKISSVEYGTKLQLYQLAVGILLILLGFYGIVIAGESFAPIILIIGLVLTGYVFFNRNQVLSISASGGVDMSLRISQGDQVDEFLSYLHAERDKHVD